MINSRDMEDRVKTCLLDLAEKDERVDYIKHLSMMSTNTGTKYESGKLEEWNTSPEKALSCTKQKRKRQTTRIRLPMIDVMLGAGLEEPAKESYSVDFSSIRRQFTQIQPSLPLRVKIEQSQILDSPTSARPSILNLTLKQPKKTIRYKTSPRHLSQSSSPRPKPKSPLNPYRQTQKSSQLRQYNEQLAIYFNPIIARQMVQMKNPNSKFVSVREAHKRNLRLGRNSGARQRNS